MILLIYTYIFLFYKTKLYKLIYNYYIFLYKLIWHKTTKKKFKSDGIKSTTKKISASGKNYKGYFTIKQILNFDIRDKILNYNPPKSIDCTTNLYQIE